MEREGGNGERVGREEVVAHTLVLVKTTTDM